MSLSEGLSKGIVAGFPTKPSEGTLAEAPKGFSKKLSLRGNLQRTLEDLPKGFLKGLSRRFPRRTSEETLEKTPSGFAGAFLQGPLRGLLRLEEVL